MAVASRGMTLIELLVGMAVASLVATVVMTGLSSLGQVHGRGVVARRNEDTAWLVLAALARDTACKDAASCRTHWVLDGSLKHRDSQSQPYAEGIASIDFVSDDRSPGLLTICLVLHDGRRYERAVVRP